MDNFNNSVTVTEVNRYIKSLFTDDPNLVKLFVHGEVSNCKYHSSGHIYFSLKDADSTLNCIMFSYSRKHINFQMKDGQQLVVYGNISLYREGEVLYTLKTKYSKEETYEIKAQNSFSMYLPKDINLEDIHFEYSGIEEITPFTPKENIGTLSIYLNDEFLNSIDIIYQGGLTFSISELLEEYHFLVLGFLFVFLVFFLLFKRNKLKHKKKKV